MEYDTFNTADKMPDISWISVCRQQLLSKLNKHTTFFLCSCSPEMRLLERIVNWIHYKRAALLKLRKALYITDKLDVYFGNITCFLRDL